MMHPDSTAVKQFLLALQEKVCRQLTLIDGKPFSCKNWQRADYGDGKTHVLSTGDVFEQAGVNFSHVRGDTLPASATQARPDLVGCQFEAMGVSIVIHPLNPYVPTTHANVRLFIAKKPGAAAVWWFGGGMDLTPYYAFKDDVIHWHQTAKRICEPFGAELYPRYKKWCDDYFFLPHRNEARGVGGLFFDDMHAPDFITCFAYIQAVGNGFLDAYLPIVNRRKSHQWGERERQFQLYRRGRYVEFNLVWDRGTLFGLHHQGRAESILVSMPPLVRWQHDYQPQADSAEAALYRDFLPAREWI